MMNRRKSTNDNSNNRNIHHYRGGRGGAGGLAARRERYFRTALEKESFDIHSKNEALKFLEGMRAVAAQDRLSLLDDERKFGGERLRAVLSFIGSGQDVDQLFVPLIELLMNEETAKPLYRSLLNRVVSGIFFTPGLMENLVTFQSDGQYCSQTSKVICSFLLFVVKTLSEARACRNIRQLAKEFRNQNIINSDTVCSYLLIDVHEKLQDGSCSNAVSIARNGGANAACWVTDRELPGDRHDNDKLNFRDIAVRPTIEELICSQREWLPLASGENYFIEDPEQRLIDKNFRLLRNDAVESMKDNLKEQAFVWKNARFTGVTCTGGKKDGRRFTETIFIFQLDPPVKKMTKTSWEKTRALPHGGLLIFCKDGNPKRLGAITLRECTSEWLLAAEGPRIGVSFVQDDVDMDLFSGAFDLVEASRNFFAYKNILVALKGLVSLPFEEELLHIRSSPQQRLPYLPQTLVVPALNKLTNDTEINLEHWCAESLAARTSLDLSQVESLYNTLTSPVALIQGPPGTGKTFIGALISRLIRRNTDETIFVVCYTNHALDQFLEYLLQFGETKLVRIGGRSSSEKLDGFNLRVLSRAKSRKNEAASRRIRQLTAKMHGLREEINDCLKDLQSNVTWYAPEDGLSLLLEQDYPEFYEQLSPPADDGTGFTIVTKKKNKKKEARIDGDDIFELWVKGNECPKWLSEADFRDERKSFEQVWDMKKDKRLELRDTLVNDIRQSIMGKLKKAISNFDELYKEKLQVEKAGEVSILEQARVIGATTSGAATYQDVLCDIRPGVVLIEEAGEVLESHVLVSLSDSTKHLILIGDHLQLRPKVENYNLTTVSGMGYDLDCSLFERLVLSKDMRSSMLQVQHRMRPEISNLIRKQTYPWLIDNDNVKAYPAVKGVNQNLVFIDHDHLEDNVDDALNKTKSNEHEVSLCVEMARYFLLQGYKPQQIVILTPYVGQLLKILRRMQRDLQNVTLYISDLDRAEMEQIDNDALDEGIGASSDEKRMSIRVSSVDNFQGEEADIVIISLVRANKWGDIGFLKEPQRVNVLLSRARHGMFIVGHKRTLLASEKGSNTWRPLFEMLESNVLNGLPSICALHEDDDPIVLNTPGKFRRFRPNGGCSRPCRYRMNCGHVCPQLCHPIDRDHLVANSQCKERCKRFPPDCPLNHPCLKLCKEECGNCETIVDSTELSCGHVMELPMCYEVSSAEAREEQAQRCKVKVDHLFKSCNHQAITTCSNARYNKTCPARCSQQLSCGHACQNECGSCKSHSCKETCGRNLFCGHFCESICHSPSDCDPCQKNCEIQCIHSQCSKICSAVCASCIEPCDWECYHEGLCGVVCGAPCIRYPCNKRCEKSLKCGHQCPGVCGEECPDSDMCQLCCRVDVKEHIVDYITMESYAEYNLNQCPIIFLPCGHFFSLSTLDGHMELSKAYDIDIQSGKFVGLRSLLDVIDTDKPKTCPDCRAVIHSIKRYGRIQKFVELRVLERKHLMQVNNSLTLLEKRMDEKGKVKVGRVKTLIRDIKRNGPMFRVFQASDGSNLVEVKRPDSRPLIKAYTILGIITSQKAESLDDESYKDAFDAFTNAIDEANESSSHRAGATARLELSKFLSKWVKTDDRKKDIIVYLDWIISHDVQFSDIVNEATKLRDSLEGLSKNEIRDVLKAMRFIAGYDYGTSSSSHWYECPNGHPYFIGECGRAMEESVCPECGERIGGSSHDLLSSNRSGATLLGLPTRY